MRKLLLILPLLAAACESENQFGKCVGIAQDDRRDSRLYYDLSIWNIFWGVVGVEMIFPPILVLHHELYCPTGRRPAPVDLKHPLPSNILGETAK